MKTMMSKSNNDKFVVRHYDRFDGYWFDLTGPLSEADAKEYWNKKTNNGKNNVSYSDPSGWYCAIFPANTKMIFNTDRDDK